MIVSGLGRHLRGRDYLPKLLRVQCGDWADVVTVKMLHGQSVTDWADRIEHLAHGFGAPSCRVTVIKAGRIALTFPRRDALSEPFDAVWAPDVPTVMSVDPQPVPRKDRPAAG